ncbi:MAG: glycosyltransferase family 39 protein [Bacteroidota bacterium]
MNSRFLVNLSLPFGIGVSSVIFIFLNLLGSASILICLVQIILVIVLFLKVKNSKQRIKQLEWLNLNKLIQSPILLLITVIYIYAWLMDAGIFLFDSIKEPHGLWDAFNYWNLKAKIISRAPYEWPALFHQMISENFHLDYPLLQTGYIANCWLYMKNESVWVPIIVSFIFTFCTIGLLASSVSIFTNKTTGLIAGLILLATPFYMTMGDSQYADNTVGFFYLATIILLTFARSGTTIRPNLLITAGAMSALSAWSKNEGLLFILCLYVSQLILLFSKNYRELLNELKYLLVGMLPVLLLIIYYKSVIAPPNDIVKAQGAETFIKLTDYSRYTTVAKWYAETFSSFGKWAFNPWWLFLAGLAYSVFLYKKAGVQKINNNLISSFILILLMLIGFFFIYIITPLDLIFHLSTSIHRLFFQLFPSFIFIYFLIIKGPSTS